MGFGRILALCKREEHHEDNRGKVCLANGEKYVVRHTQSLRVRDVCIEIAKQLSIAPVALDFFTLMTTDCEHCLRSSRQGKQACTKENDHYLNPNRLLHADECSAKVFFFRLAFKAIPGPDIKNVDGGAFQYFVMQCRWDYLNGRISCLTKKDHLTLLVLESIIRGNENSVSCRDVLDNPKKYGLLHLFQDDEFSVREIRNHLKKQISQFKTCQDNIDKAKSSFLSVLEGVGDFGIKKIVVKKFYYNAAAAQQNINQVEWEILICANGLKKRRTYKDEEDFDGGERGNPDSSKDEIISDYKDIEYIEIKHFESDEIINISRQQGFLEVISVGKSMSKKESLITLIEGFYRLLVNQYKTLTKYADDSGLELPLQNMQPRDFEIHGPIERKKAETLLKAVPCPSGDRSGIHMIRRSRQVFDSYNLSFISGGGDEVRHYEVKRSPEGHYGIINGPTFESLVELLEHYQTTQVSVYCRNTQRRGLTLRAKAILQRNGGLSTTLKKYCPIPREGRCALFDEQIVVEPPHPPSSSRPTNPEYHFTLIGNMELARLDHTFTSGNFGEKFFKARCPKDDDSAYQEVFCRRIETSHSPDFKEKVIKCAEKMDVLVHRNLVHFYGICFYNDENTYLALEWIDNGTLDDYLNRETDVTVERLIMFAAQISEACMFLHLHNYIHGWLAAHNVLVVSDEYVKLSDVSVPCLREEDLLQPSISGELNRSPWKARECFQDRPYSKESDVWAFGVVLWEMFSKLKPFQNMTDDMILQVFQQNRHLACPRWCPDGVRKIMKSCWFKDPPRRPTFVNIVTELRSVSQNLSPEQKQCKLPQTIDENFSIEPLNQLNKQSLLCSEEQPCATSNQRNDDGGTSGGTLYDLGSEGSEATSTSLRMTHLDFIPEKGPREIWSPEEIELKRLERKRLRVPAGVEVVHELEPTYDRINIEESEFQEMLDETSEVRHRENGDLPTPDDEEPTEDDPLVGSYEAPGRPSENYYSICDLDHVGFLACQLGQEDTSEDYGGTSSEESSDEETSDEETIEEASHCDNSSPRVSTSTLQNLDPFASDFDTRAKLVFANFYQGKPEEADVNETPTGKHPLAKQSHNSNASAYKQTDGYINRTSPSSKRHVKSNGYAPNSTKVEAIRHANHPSPLSLGNDKSPSMSRRDTNSPSSLGLLEFSKLDPFASSAEGAGFLGDSNSASAYPPDVDYEVKEPLLGRWKPSHAAQNLTAKAKTQSKNMPQKSRFATSSPKLAERAKHDEQLLDDGLSSFLERDPFSEILTNNQNQSTTDQNRPSPRTDEMGFQEKRPQSGTNVRMPERNRIDGGTASVSKQPKGKVLHGGIGGGGVIGGVGGGTEKYSKMSASPSVYQKGYVPVSSSPVSSRARVVATPSERESSYQMPANTAKDAATEAAATQLPIFSERDPFSEMQPEAGEINKEKIGKGASGSVQEEKATGRNRVESPSRLGYTRAPAGQPSVTNKSKATSSGSAKLGYVKAPVHNGHHVTKSMLSPSSRAVDEDRYDSAKSSPSYSITSFSDRDIFQDILQGSGDVTGEKSADTSSYLNNVPSTGVSRDSKRFGSGAVRSVNNGTCVSPYHSSTAFTSASNGEKPRGALGYHANSLPPTEVASNHGRYMVSGITHSRSNATCVSPYHLSTTSNSRDNARNGEKPRGAPSSNPNLPPDVASCDRRNFGFGVTHPTNTGARQSACLLSSTSSYTSSNLIHGIPRETLQSSVNDDGEKSNETSNRRPTFPYTELASNQTRNIRSAALPSGTAGGKPYNRSSPSDYSSFVDRSKVAEKPNYGKGPDEDTSNETVPGLSSFMSMSLGDRDPFSEIGAGPTFGVGSKSSSKSNEVYSSIIPGQSKYPTRIRAAASDEVGGEKSEVDKNECLSEVSEVSGPGVTFGNRDPFAELCFSKEDPIKEHSAEPSCMNGISFAETNEGSKQNLGGENVETLSADKNGEVSDLMKEMRKDPLAGSSSRSGNETPKRDPNEARQSAAVQASGTHSSSNEPENKNVPGGQMSCRVDGATGGSPSGNDGRKPRQSPEQAKKKADRRISDIDSEYAKVTIIIPGSHPYQSVCNGALEMPGGCDLGAVGGEGTANEMGLDSDAGRSLDDREETVVDPFNIPAAVESIDNLDPTWPESRPEKTKGTRKIEVFEESMKSHLIPFASLTFNDQEDCLGRGAFGVVRRAKFTRRAQHKTRPTTDVAVKCLKEGASEIYKNSFKQEAINLMKLENKFIVRFLGISYDNENKLLLITELVPQGSLDNYLRDPKNSRILGNQVLLQFAIQITMGMQYLESKKLVHRDLAARNILVATESHVKISDFGLSRIYDDEYYRSHRENQKLPIRWLAPECLEQKKFTVYSDVWSLGVTLWEMFSYGKRPYEEIKFNNASELIEYLKKGNQLEQPRDCPDEIFSNIKECWHLPPVKRMTFFLLKTFLEEVLKDKYSKKPYFM